LLIAAVIAAVLFLLLSGGKLFKPASNTVTSAPVVAPANTTKPSSPEIPANTKKPTQAVAATKPATQSTATKPAVKPVISSKPKPTLKPTTKPISVAELPTIDTNTKPTTAQKPALTKPTTKPATTVKPSQKPTAPVASIKPRANTATTPTPNVKPTKPVTPVNTPSSRGSYLSSYRIVVGTYKTQPRAETFAAQVRRQGFPARAVLSQYLYLVIVGPYSAQGTAASAFSRLKNVYPGAILYRPDGSRSGSSAPTPKATPKATPRKILEGSSSRPATLNSTLAKQPVQASMTTSKNLALKTETNPKIQTAYLQVGAFKNAASASPLLINLRKAGYTARLRVSSNGVTRVIIGPLTGTPLELARNDLRARGLQPFTIR
jgi:cell division protein FtsN